MGHLKPYDQFTTWHNNGNGATGLDVLATKPLNKLISY